MDTSIKRLEVIKLLIRKYGSKTGGIIAGVAFVTLLILFGVGWYIGLQMHKNEINQMIGSRNGKIISIKVIKLEESPFLLKLNDMQVKVI